MNKNKNQVKDGRNILVSGEIRKKLVLLKENFEFPNVNKILEILLIDSEEKIKNYKKLENK